MSHFVGCWEEGRSSIVKGRSSFGKGTPALSFPKGASTAKAQIS